VLTRVRIERPGRDATGQLAPADSIDGARRTSRGVLTRVPPRRSSEKIFDNPVDCTRQPENEEQVKDEARGSDPTRFACEGPLRGAGVRAVVPGRLASAVRGPPRRRDGQHGPAMSAGMVRPPGRAGTGLVATSFFPQPLRGGDWHGGRRPSQAAEAVSGQF
jgi:hypothetical protein